MEKIYLRHVSAEAARQAIRDTLLMLETDRETYGKTIQLLKGEGDLLQKYNLAINAKQGFINAQEIEIKPKLGS